MMFPVEGRSRRRNTFAERNVEILSRHLWEGPLGTIPLTVSYLGPMFRKGVQVY